MYGATWSSIARVGGCYRLRVPRWIWANSNFLWIIYDEGRVENFPCCFCTRWFLFHPDGELHPHFLPRHLESERVMSLARFFDSLQLSRPTMLYSERPSINFPPFPYLFRSFFTHGGGVGAAMRISGSTSVPLLCCVVFCTFSTLRASFLFCCYSNGQHEI